MTNRRYHVVIPDTDYYRKMVKCQSACPVQTDARAYVTAVARGELEKGYQIAHDPNPLSTICGRICGAPCEIACRRGSVGPDFDSVAIRPLKRVLTERYGPETAGHLPGIPSAAGDIVPRESIRAATPYAAAKKEKTFPGLGANVDYSSARWSRENLKLLAGEQGHKAGKVAIIGAGPASLTVANDLALLGHQVSIYEAGPKTGGMMRYGVPVYRVDQQAMDMEIQSILDLGVTIHFDMRVGKDVMLADLRRDFDAVFLGMGLMSGRRLSIEGANLDGVVTAVDLLLNYNLGYKMTLGQRVIVVGGGDVAMDAARTALRLGQATAEQKIALGETEQRSDEASDAVHEALDVARTALRLGVAEVKMISLESWDELPASKFEIEEALEEGITIHPRLGPNRIIGKNGKVTGLEVIEVESVFDENKRFNPKFKPKSEKVMECDTMILAIGQSADLGALGDAKDIRVSSRGLIEINPDTGQTSAPDVFAGGDVAYGPRLIINAVRDGHLAALGIDEKIQGRSLQYDVVTHWTDLPSHTMPENWTKLTREKIPGLPVERRTGLSVVELGYSQEQAAIQGLRCLECSVNTVFDGSKCVLCNGCVDVCPWDCLKIVSIGQLTGDDTVMQVVEAAQKSGAVAAMLKDDTACTRCALCAERCPTDAITMEAFRFKETLTYNNGK
jgi:NADPH-dependent glutamate synthase beta subunit-like oxidoreductase